MSRFSIPLPRTLVCVSVFFLGLFWLVMPWYVGEEAAVLIMVARGILSLIVTIMYAWSLKMLWNEQVPDASHALIMGICLAFSADTVGSVLSIIWRWNGMPNDWRTASIWYFPSYITAIAAMMHIVAPGAIKGKIPKRNVIVVSCAIGVSALLASFIIFYQLRGLGK